MGPKAEQTASASYPLLPAPLLQGFEFGEDHAQATWKHRPTQVVLHVYYMCITLISAPTQVVLHGRMWDTTSKSPSDAEGTAHIRCEII